jgi:hypothetical protein
MEAAVADVVGLQLPERPEAAGGQRRQVPLIVHEANLVLSDHAAT